MPPLAASARLATDNVNYRAGKTIGGSSLCRGTIVHDVPPHDGPDPAASGVRGRSECPGHPAQRKIYLRRIRSILHIYAICDAEGRRIVRILNRRHRQVPLRRRHQANSLRYRKIPAAVRKLGAENLSDVPPLVASRRGAIGLQTRMAQSDLQREVSRPYAPAPNFFDRGVRLWRWARSCAPATCRDS